MRSMDEWARFRRGPQRKLEQAIDGLYSSGLSHDQRKQLSNIDDNYHRLMKIAEGLAGEVAARGEEVLRLVKGG